MSSVHFYWVNWELKYININPEHAYELPPIEGIDKEYAIEKLSRSYQNFCFKVRVPNTREEMLFCPICRRSYSIGYMSNSENH